MSDSLEFITEGYGLKIRNVATLKYFGQTWTHIRSTGVKTDSSSALLWSKGASDDKGYYMLKPLSNPTVALTARNEHRLNIDTGI